MSLRRRQAAFWPLYSFFVVFSMFLVFVVPYVAPWYVVPFCAVTIVLAAKGLMDLAAFLPEDNRRFLGWSVATSYLAVFALVLPLTFRGEKRIQEFIEEPVRAAIGRYLNHVAASNETIGGEALGYFGYYSRRAYYDYPGLASAKIVDWMKSKPKNRTLTRMLAHFQPDYLVLRPAEYNDALQPEGEGFLRNYKLQRVFRIDESRRPLLLFPDSNIDLEFRVFKKIAQKPQTP